MLDFCYCIDPDTQQTVIETSISGKLLLTTPQLNKGTAFSQQERHEFNLLGKLPHRVETLDEQVTRAYQQYNAYKNRLKQNIYLNNLHDKNQVLFYKLVSEHLSEILPTIYTPIVGTAVKQFSHEFRQPRGLYISYPEQDDIEAVLSNRSNPEIDLIVVSDGEGVLGIGDQGIGGMDIPVAKLMVYTLCGGINPCRTLPIFLDVGTNNGELLADPMYLGWRHTRITGKDYDHFIDRFVKAVQKHFPKAMLHWEDFGREHAWPILERYQDQLCTFNDDIQGTGAVTLAALLAAVNANRSSLPEQRIVVFGAGSAGTGISDQIYSALLRHGLSEKQARRCFWLIDRQGLLMNDQDDLTNAQAPYARDRGDIVDWQVNDLEYISLHDTIKHVKPTILIGASAVSGAFNQAVIEEMAKHNARPIILPLSNPTERVEATPEDIFQWTHGNALIATGSPFQPVEYKGKTITIAQCNNALVFPGIGLGVIAVTANRLSDDMIWQACEALVDCAPINNDEHAPLLPSLDDAQHVAKQIALAVAKQAIKEGHGIASTDKSLEQRIDDLFWQPQYLNFVRK